MATRKRIWQKQWTALPLQKENTKEPKHPAANHDGSSSLHADVHDLECLQKRRTNSATSICITGSSGDHLKEDAEKDDEPH